MKYVRWLLLPFSFLYGLVVNIRNWFFDAGLFKSYKFNIPVISVGNMEAGGAGKTPMTEYLVRLLKDNPEIHRGKLATLSRGYGRKTKGFIVAGELESRVKNQESGVGYQISGIKYQDKEPATGNLQLTTNSLSTIIGDEPAQFKQKFPDITVAVCEKRAEGIKRLLPDHGVVILDDAYQHRAVEPGLSILLFDYNRLNVPHFLLPAGNFREPFSGRWRAQIIIVTKCPELLTMDDKDLLAQKVKPLPYQHLFFTAINYRQLQDLNGETVDFVLDRDTTVFLLTGIANAKPLLDHVGKTTTNVIHHNYPDHHPFTLKNITKLAGDFLACTSQKKIIITTEKDAQRLERSWFTPLLTRDNELPVYVLPIQAQFLFDGDGQRFNQLIMDYVREY